MKRTVSILLMALNDDSTDAIVNAFGPVQITYLKSKPSYANYLKTLQYLPAAIIMELPPQFHDQLHFVQMVKQNSRAGDIPIICFGDRIDGSIEKGMKNVGIEEYFSRPFDMKRLAAKAIDRIRRRGIVLSAKNDDPEKEKEIDVSQILSVHTSRQRKIDLMVKHVSDIMAFPFTVSMALQLLNSDKSGANDLAKIIETDPTISANFLKKANSVYFAGKNTRTVTMKDAIVRIGFTETRRIITGMAVMQLFDTRRYSPGFNRIEFWFHCLATAKIAEQLARMTRMVSPDEAFLAGILHDFGIILLDEFFPRIFERILQISTDFGMRFYEAEGEILSVTHNDLVGRLFELWKIPERINHAVVNHYTAMESAVEPQSEKEVMAVVVSMANILAKAYLLGASCDQFVVPLDNRFFSMTHATFGLPDNFYRDIVDHLAAYKQLLKIDEDAFEKRLPPHKGTAPVFTIGMADFTAAVFNPIKNYLRQSGHMTVSIAVPEESYDTYHCRCDIVFVFTDAATRRDAVETLKRIRRRPALPEATPSATEAETVPIIVFINKQSPCTAAVNIAGISLLSAAIDLRMLDVHIDAVVHGRSVKSLPWESILKPPKPVTAEMDGMRGEMQPAYHIMRHYKERCAELHIVSDDHIAAESYAEKARLEEQKNDYAAASAMIALAAEYYRRSYLRYELSQCEKNIAGRETALKKTVGAMAQ
ncbi:MAG: HDOD domain-containing protein [Chitinispirillaceae bacterium]|nr:HDOD domain-containing protein [Chitinispirillaceae bacterium]